MITRPKINADVGRIDMASPPNILPVLPGAAAQEAQPQAYGQADNWQGGYDCDFVQPPPEAVQSECPICHLVLREPYQAPCCGNSFCRTCIEPIRLGNANCPTCRRAGFTTFPDKRLERSIKPLKVFCSRRNEGCEWKGELGALERHVKEECFPTVVECDFDYAGCESRLPRKDMASHLAESLVTHMSLMAAHGRKTATEVQKTAIEAQRTLEERDMQIAQLQREQTGQRVVVDELARVVDELEGENKSLKDLLELHSHLCTPPVTFTMTNFAQHKRNKDTWYSPPFYTHPHDYKMCIKVICHEDTIFIGAPLMRGKFDDQLLWPFQKTVCIRILNHCSGKNHINIMADFSIDSRCDNVGLRVTVGERQLKGCGDSIPYTALDSQGDCTKAYIKDNTIQLQVTEVDDTLQASRLETRILSTFDRISLCTPPCRFVMTHFEQHKESGHLWYSPSFYTHGEGYRMCLQVDADCIEEGKGTHVSVFTFLMRGEFDSHLRWPFRGIVTIQLVNQLEDKEHHTKIIPYTDTTPDTSAALVTDGERSEGWGTIKFICHSMLGLRVAINRQYLKDDCLVFRIVSVKLN